MDKPTSEPQKPTNSYGKRPVWHWILLYVVVAIVVYGVIYYAFIHKSGGGGYHY